jgi:hypothetical protein
MSRVECNSTFGHIANFKSLNVLLVHTQENRIDQYDFLDANIDSDLGFF